MVSSDSERQSPPWVSVWLNPRLTIERVLTRYSTRQILLLAGLHFSLTVTAYVIEGELTRALLDWRVLAAVTGGGLIGIAVLFVAALCFTASGWVFRGRATAADLRATLAWGNAPTVIGLAVCFAILAAWWISARIGLPQPPPDLVAILVQVTQAVVGLWSLVTLLLMLSRVQKFGFWRTTSSYALALLIIVFPFFLVRAFLFEPFNTPSGSMAPSLIVGDYFFVSKYAYGYTRYSLPFSLPLFARRILGREPQRGDVVVYRHPRSPSVDFVKRIVGLPGDKIQITEGVVYINGQPVSHAPLGEYVDPETMQRTKRWHENLPNGVSYEVFDAGNSYLDNTEVYSVPPGRYFVIGDNRNMSADSRLPVEQGGGTIPFENLIGRVEAIFFSKDSRAPAG